MRGKYFVNLLLIGLLPMLLVTGGAYYTLVTQKPVAPPPNAASLDSNLQALGAPLSAIAQALVSSIQKSYSDIVTLATSPTDEACQAFVSSHPGVTAVFQLSADGRVEKVSPPGSTVVDGSYATTDEFKNIAERLFTEGRNPYQFYTARLPFPAFIFTSSTPGKSIVGVVLNLESFFTGLDLKGGEAFLLEAGTGRYFYHSDRAKMGETFNAAQEAWLLKAQEDLKNKAAGKVANGEVSAVAYYPLGIAAFGVVQIVPYASVAPAPPPRKDLRASLQEWLLSPLSLALCVALAWVLLVGSLRMKSILKPLQDALSVVQRAAGGGAALTDADIRSIGSDEPGKIVAATAQWVQRLEQERDLQVKEREDEIRRTKTNLGVNLDTKTKEMNTAAQQISNINSELEQANQRLTDKVKEMEAMKGMAEGLRTQSEQAKGENSKLKTQILGMEQKQTEMQENLSGADRRMRDLEAKLLKSVSAASAIQVSQVRVAAIRTMAEELKTTLGIIKGYVSSALGSAQGGITEKQQEFLGMVINRSARLEKFINDLMDIYLVEIEQETAPREEVNLASEIEGLAFNFQPQADIKGLKIKVEAKPDVPKVPVVRRRFTQLWNILYLQMIKDAPRSATLTIAVEPMGEDVKVTVHDPGLTVKEESLPGIFDEFYDPKHPASVQLAGTGLKLALVKTILAAHGGGAVAEKANPGTKFILTFPTKVKKKGEIPPALPKPVVPVSTAPGAPAPKPVSSAPGVKIPSFGPMPTIPGGLIRPSGPTVSTGPAVPTTPPPQAPPVSIPIMPKPSVPTSPMPAAPVIPPPKPVVPGGLDALIDKTPVKDAPVPPAARDSIPSSAPKSGTPAVPPPAGGKPIPPPLSLDGLDALMGQLSTPPPMSKPTATPPPPPPAGMVKPPVPPASPVASASTPPLPTPLGGVVPASPQAPKVVPTTLKPTAPPAGILDLDNTDSFKIDELKPPVPPAAPKPAVPPPGAPPAGKPIVKDLNKESGADGELID